MSDLAARILAEIEETEQAEQAILEPGAGYLFTRRKRAERELRRCAADRKIVEQYQHYLRLIDHGLAGVCTRYFVKEMGEVLQALAEGYGISEEEDAS